MPIQALVVTKPGPEAIMEWREFPDTYPGPEDILIKQTAIGVNFMDIFHRIGYYPSSSPMVPGLEAVGVIEAVGRNVKSFKEGDRVVYGTLPIGAYITKRIVNQNYVIKAPDYIDDITLAACFAKGLTAHYLLRRVFKVGLDTRILVHAAAGGLGQIMSQWATADGALVYGTVGSDEKIPAAKKAGCKAVINYTKYQNFSEIIMKLTNGAGLQVVYDGIGHNTFYQSLCCLGALGLMVSTGEVSGPVPPLDIGWLIPRGLFLTRPTLFLYKYDRHELLLSATEVFYRLSQGIIKPNVYKIYRLEDAAKAHLALEHRQAVGQQVLIVD